MNFSHSNNRPVGIDLFAGAGGLSLGFEQAGFDIVAAVEIDPIHCATHEYNFPGSKTICASVVDVTGEEIRALAELGNRDIEVVFGGAPCQGFSLMGKRALDDPRNKLVFHYVRIVRELNPKYCVFENVKGLTLGAHRKFLDELIAALHDAGYDVLMPYKVLNAAEFGVPQDRRRLFLVGTRRGEVPPHYPEPTGRVTVREAIADLPNADLFDELKVQDSVAVDWVTHASYARRLRGLEADADDFSYPREFDSDILTASMRTVHTELSKNRFTETKCGDTEPISRFRKLDPEGICNTLRAGTDSARGAFTSPRPIHPVFPRVITVREAARLHSYPDWFRFHITKWHGFRQIGNSVPPLLARAVGREILQAMGIVATKPSQSFVLRDSKILGLDMSAAARRFGVKHTVIAQRLRKNNSILAAAEEGQLQLLTEPKEYAEEQS
ncbi:DNA-cytosine methyltransferase [Caballeronia sordidicola]|uniref:Cytosine-specific methyltransferase n=1 Tax=Caballeronia sordidicola TaxID=196367 RepID=A0A158H121_CABSO|nr:DNA cytosine methyltransferase [Caballeronia sordidicola]SAL37579.1 DNA-cytosine methyltransferase [Caballeronia sordidicola]